MTTRAGHIASLIIAAFFAALLIAAWFPSAPDGEAHRRLFAFQDITQVYKKEVAGRQETARTTDAAPRLSAPATANEKSVEPNRRAESIHKEEKSGEQSMSAWDIFFNIRLTDLVMIILMGLVAWNSWNILLSMKERAEQEREASDEVLSLIRAANAMEALAKTVIAATATDAPETSAVEEPPVKRQRRKRAAKNAVASATPGQEH